MQNSVPSEIPDDKRVAEPRIEALDSLRGIAALSIMVFHYEAMLYSRSADAPVDVLKLRYAMLGVELFFVISGFVILATLSRSASALEFLLHRAARIYPAYWFSVAITSSVLIWDHEDVLRTACVNLTMLQSFVFVKGLVPPYWTLAYELWFYVIMALVFRMGLVPRLPVLAAIWLMFAFAVRLLGLHSYGWSGIVSMLPFGHFFIAGMMIYRVLHKDETLLTKIVLMASLVYAGFGRDDWSHISGQIYLICTAVFFAAIYFAADRNLEILRMRWLVRIGQMSYSLYLLHFTVALACIQTVQRIGWPIWSGVAAAVPLSIMSAAASRKWIEVPGQRAINALEKSAFRTA